MTEWATIAVRFALYADLMLLFGLPLFGLYNGRPVALLLPFRPLVVLTAAGGLLLSLAALLLLAASMSGVPVSEVDRASIDMLVTETSMGTAWQVRIAALLAALVISLPRWRSPLPWLVGVSTAAAVALATLAWTGHGAADEGRIGWVHLSADILHLLASAIWVGALLALLLLLLRPARKMSSEHLILSHDALAGFGAIGSAVVALILLSGLVNGWLLVGPDNIAALFTTLYGQLLLAKLLLFAAMLGLAAINRFRLTPAFERELGRNHIAAVAGLRRSLTTETGAAILILFLVAWLGTLSPPASGM